MATMTSNQQRRIVTPPSGGPSNKRKGGESLQIPLPPSEKLVRPNVPRPRPRRGPVQASAKSPEPASSNQLLAGYLAHEFLTKGTLFGQPWDSARGEADESRRPKQPRSCQEAEDEAEPRIEGYQRYLEVASLLKTDGAHLPGIVNPTQLARFLQL